MPPVHVLRAIEDRVLWLSTAIVDHANAVRPNPSGIKVGGHQASSASMVSIMTALWFAQLTKHDRVSVKPHASPVLHAINFLLGGLDPEDLTTLRSFGGLQSYPSRTKDRDHPDYSTGSVGIGATAPIWAAIAHRYLNQSVPYAPPGRQYSLLGDAELDEGACWEAIVDPMIRALGEIVWIVDLNRQSLDRVVPDVAAPRLEGMFDAAGWQVITAKYGAALEEVFARHGGSALRTRIDEMPNPEYQRLLRCPPRELRARLTGVGEAASEIESVIADLPDVTLMSLIRNLGGHDLDALRTAFDEIDDSRPTVIFAYTIKGYGLPFEGHPQNHSARLDQEQLSALAERLGIDSTSPWTGFSESSDEGELCKAVSEALTRDVLEATPPPSVPIDLGRTPRGYATTQSALGRTLMDLSRDAPDVAQRVVTVSPDVSSSTNLAGWVNKVGVWTPDERRDWFADDPGTNIHWRERATGQHIELGIAETNLVCLLGELGATWSRSGEPLMPIGVLYDPFVGRALEPWSFGIYAGGQSILVGTPSGITLAPEGGAHQSVITPSIGLEQPGCNSYEPAFAIDTEWCLLAAMSRLGKPDGMSSYLRLSTRPVDQTLANLPVDPVARERRRRHVTAGAYVLRRHHSPQLTIAFVGAMATEALAAAERLDELGFGSDLICVTSPGLIFEALQARRRPDSAGSWILDAVFPQRTATPLVTVLDGHPHTLAFLAGIHQVRGIHLGVSGFGQSGDLQDLYRHHQVDVESIVIAGLDLVG